MCSVSNESIGISVAGKNTHTQSNVSKTKIQEQHTERDLCTYKSVSFQFFCYFYKNSGKLGAKKSSCMCHYSSTHRHPFECFIAIYCESNWFFVVLLLLSLWLPKFSVFFFLFNSRMTCTFNGIVSK